MATCIDVLYEGDLHCTAIHTPSGDRMRTDAPPDNRGRGEHFSPTDLMAAAMGTCVLTVMGIAARDRDIDMRGARCAVRKEMSNEPRRHISKLSVAVTLPARLGDRERLVLERAAHACPVHNSLAPATEVELEFAYE